MGGRGAQEVVTHFTDWQEDDGLPAPLGRFQTFCIPRQYVVMERYQFYSRSQQAGETILQVVSALRSLAVSCEFAERDVMLRDRIVMGVRDRRVQQALLKKPELSLAQAIDIALAEEAASRDANMMAAARQADSPGASRGGRGG